MCPSFLPFLFYWLLLIKPNSMEDSQDSVFSPLISIYLFLCVWSHQFLYLKMITWKSLLMSQSSPFALQTLHDKLLNFYTWIAHTLQTRRSWFLLKPVCAAPFSCLLITTDAKFPCHSSFFISFKLISNPSVLLNLWPKYTFKLSIVPIISQITATELLIGFPTSYFLP